VPTGPSGLHQYRLRVLFDIIDMPWNWPVIVNFHEAKAFANWRNERDGVAPDSPNALRILTEMEHHRIRDKSHHDLSLGTARDAVMAHSGGPDMLKRGYNLNLSYMSESPVDALPPASTGFHDVFGNVWEWCEDHFSALPGFRVHPFYDDFSLPCFDGLHHIIMGGSYMSTGDEGSIFARFHFRPHFHQFSGFRLVRPDAKRNTRMITSCMDNQGPYVGTNPFRSSSATKAHEADVTNQRVFNESIQHHYDSENVPTFLKPASNYPTRLANLVFSLAERFSIEPIRALDVGCGAGGVTFELCRRFREVTGVDLNGPLIDYAKTLAKAGRGSYSSRIEGELSVERSFTLPNDVDRTRAEFKQADAYCLPAEMTNFDVVLVSNLLCEIPLPNTALGRMAGPRALVRPGGLLVIASPFSWEENITPKDLWLGGFVDENGKSRTSVQGLQALFGDAFALVHETELPTATRKHSRQFAVSISHVSVWQARK
jgi:putative 4-mercaptohistidine N1-methyltranferase